MDTRFLTDKQVAARYCVDRTTVHRWARKGLIPRAHRISPGCSRWSIAELDAADAERASKRGAA